MRPIQYSNYLCDTCNRQKSFVLDSKHVDTLSCVITQGCTGRLMFQSYSSTPSITKPIFGVKDWTKRSRGLTTPQEPEVVNPSQTFLGSSLDGALTIAVRDEDVANKQTIQVVLSIAKPSSIPSKQYFFTPSIPFSVIMGADNNGKILRITQNDAEEGRVKVRKNGVLLQYNVDYTVSLNSILLEDTVSTASSIDVEILESSLRYQKTLIFTRNEVITQKSAWSNVRHVSIEGNRYWLFTCSNVNGISQNSKAFITNIVDVNNWQDKTVFLLSTPPCEFPDRCYVKILHANKIKSDFEIQLLSNPISGFYVRSTILTDIFPPIYVSELWSSTDRDLEKISKDEIVYDDSDIDLDSSNVYITNKHVIGPI